jgi:TRAP-type transport system small permease protein
MERVRSIFVQACGYAAAIALAAMMLLTVADVVLRSMFNYPIRGMLEIIELLLACSFFVALPASFLRDEHIVVDMIDPMAPEWVPALKQIGNMVTLVVIAAITWQGWKAMQDTLMFGDVTSDLQIPRILYWVPVLFGMGGSVVAAAMMLLRARATK